MAPASSPSEPDDPSVYEWACGYARKGFPVLPTTREKTPRTPHGVKDATCDLRILKEWWVNWPDAGVGLAMGVGPVPLVVVDIDPRNGGDESLAALERDYGPLPATRRALTGQHPEGRGQHFYFRLPVGVRVAGGVLAAGVDLKSTGGYVVAPPSLHASGVRYEIDIGSPTSLASLPDWIIAKMGGHETQVIKQTGGIVGSLAHRFEQLGMLGRRIDLERYIVDCPQAHLHSTGKPGSSSTVVFVPAAGRTRGWFHCKHSHCANLNANGAELWAALGIAPGTPLVASASPEASAALFPLASTIAPEAVDWILPGWIPRGVAISVEGDTAAGKSTMLIDLCARITTRRPLPHSDIVAPVERWLWITEDPAAYMVVPRLIAAGADLGKVHVLDKQKGTVIIPDGLPLVEQLMLEAGVRHVVFDPAVDYFASTVDVLKDQSVAAAMGAIVALAEKWRAVFYLVRHNTKGKGAPVTHRAAGAARIGNACRAKWSVTVDKGNPDSPTEKHRVLSSHDLNLGVDPQGMCFTIAGDSPTAPPRIAWGGLSTLTADELMRAQDAEPSGADRVTKESATDTALTILLDNGVPTRMRGGPTGTYLVAHGLASSGPEGFYALLGVSRPTIARWGGEKALGICSGRAAGIEGPGAFIKFPASERPGAAPREPGEDD